jgi:hypothetical protein
VSVNSSFILLRRNPEITRSSKLGDDDGDREGKECLAEVEKRERGVGKELV